MGKMPGSAASGREKAYIHLRENVLTDPELQGRIPDTEDPGDAREFIRLDTLFHQQLIDAAGNELISRTYSKLHFRQIVVGVSALFRTGGRREQVCSEHQDILDALVSGDAAKAQEAIDHHLAVTRDLLLRT